MNGRALRLEKVDCNLCGADDASRHLTISGFNICRCRNCGLLYVNPRPSAEDITKVYDRSYFSNGEDCPDRGYYGYYAYEESEEQIKDTFRPRLDRIESILGAGRGKLLDIGCAMGFFMSVAEERGWRAHGTDVSEEAASKTGKLFGDRFYRGTVEQATFERTSFDAVTLWDVIEHLPDPSGTLKTVNGLMKPGGVIALVTPDAGSLAAALLRSKWPEFRRVEEHIYFFSGKTLAAMLENNGFEVVLTEGAGRIFDIPGIINELKIYNRTIFTALSRLSAGLGLARVRLYVKPGYKTAMYARKVREA